MLSTTVRAWSRAAFLTLSAGLFASCGGGGGDDDEDEIIEDEDATGLWFGSYTQSGARRNFFVIAAPNGQFVGAVANPNGRLLVGTGGTTQTSLNASGTVFAPLNETLANGQASAGFSIAAARIMERASITGNYSGGGEAATFSVNYDPKTSRGASLATLQSTYSLYPPPTAGGTNATLSINSAGAATYATSTGCNGTGTFAVIDSTLNMYSWTLSISGCPSTPDYTASGLAALNDSPTGGTNNMITVLGATAARDRGFAFIGTDP